MKKLIFSFLGSFYSLIAFSQNATNDLISNWANSDVLRQAHVGIAVHDADQGYQIAGYNSDKLFIPASSLKVLTSLVSMQSLTQDFKYTTRLAYEGQIVDSILYGNVFIIGSGDPSFGSKNYSNHPTYNEISSLCAYKIKNLGIKKIEGEIISDASIFDSQPISPSWQWNDLGSGFGAGAWGINANENEYEIWYNTNKAVGEVADILSIVPFVKDLDISNQVSIDNEDGDDNSYIYGDPFSYKKRIVGTIPFRKNAFKVKGSIPNPPLALAQNIMYELKLRNINANNATTHIYKRRNDASLIQIDSFSSMPLIELVRQANYHSINLYCESFLKTLGYKKGYSGSSLEGINHVKNYLSTRGIDYTGLNMQDGSGLSARNLISPNLLSRFLSSYAKENGMEFTASLLPEVGNEGTVRRMLKNSEAKGRVWMKSGTMSQVMTYTGIMKAKSGKWITFSIMVNAYTIKAPDMRKFMENIIEGIYVTQ